MSIDIMPTEWFGYVKTIIGLNKKPKTSKQQLIYIFKQKQIQTVISLPLIPWKKRVIYRFSQEWNGITSMQCFSVGTLQKGELPGFLLSEGQ